MAQFKGGTGSFLDIANTAIGQAAPGTKILGSPFLPNRIMDPVALPQNPFTNSAPVTPGSSLAGQTFQPLLDKLYATGRTELPQGTSLAPQFAGQSPVPIKRPDPSFFQNLFNQKLQPVQNQYFGAGGVSDQTTEGLNQKGFLTGGPSGVAGQLFGQTVSEPYAQAVANTQNQVNIIRQETELQLSQFDAQRQDQFRTFMADLQNKDNAFGVDRAVAQSNIDNTFLSLEADIQRAIANGATIEEQNRLEQNLKMFELMTDTRLKENQLAQQGSQFNRELAQKESDSQREAYIAGSQIPGFLSPSTPFETLGIPRPLESSDVGTYSPSVSSSGPPYPAEKFGDLVVYNGQQYRAVGGKAGQPGLSWQLVKGV